ncbi:MAG: phosphotransacetylase family protein [Synechococcaceae cyanobacterium SM2_3_60]|nr:phosphotransacetylase family protein [Synechococcaceae cyanobacterium SM2_3_60]
MTQTLVVGSTEAYSGKSAVLLGVAQALQARGVAIAYGKPLGACLNGACAVDSDDPDIAFIAETLHLSPEQVLPTVLRLDISTLAQRLHNSDYGDITGQLATYAQSTAGLTLVEGPSTLSEGLLFDLSLAQMATRLDATVLLIVRYHSHTCVESVLAAKQQLGERLQGVILNDIPAAEWELVTQQIVPFLASQAIAVWGCLPANRLLRSISVAELVHQLNAEVLCCADRLDLMVEEFAIGAMNVNSALKYFRRSQHKAVITGGDRTDIQLAALETSTHCLILTGQIPPTELIRSRAEELEVPILSVELDTLTTVERIERVFGQARLHEPAKVQCMQELLTQHVDLSLLFSHLAMSVA